MLLCGRLFICSVPIKILHFSLFGIDNLQKFDYTKDSEGDSQAV